MTELLKCPFCGNDALAMQWNFDATAQCQTCGAHHIRPTVEKAIEAWNIRTETDLLAALETTLDEALGWYDDCRGDECTEPWVAQARDAIEKAKHHD